MTAAGWTCGLLAAAALASGAGAGRAAAPPELLQGRTLNLITGDRDKGPAVQVTLVRVDAPDLDVSATSHPRIAAASSEGLELTGVVEDLGKRLAAADALPRGGPGSAQAPADSYALSLDEHVIFDAGSSMNAGIEAGFPKGATISAIQAASYVADYRLIVHRPDGRVRSFGCQARATGEVSRFSGQELQRWAPLVAGAREDCMAQLVSRVKAGRDFLRP
ncbi:MAG TPA: hypothetical protein VG248_00895 [Caulobacteraceae bacterium]|nr:hypothetical protein [Caulobacteraceae bacterium]